MRLGQFCEAQQLYLSPGSVLHRPSAHSVLRVCNSLSLVGTRTRWVSRGPRTRCYRSETPVQEWDWGAAVVIGIRTRRKAPFFQQAGEEDRSWGRESSGSHRGLVTDRRWGWDCRALGRRVLASWTVSQCWYGRRRS